MSWRGIFLISLLSSLPLQGAPISVLTWNVAGNGATDWTTNAPQVQAIGRVVSFLHPDVITFQEIPNQYVAEMDHFVGAFLPGYTLARSSGTDGVLRSVIITRHPLVRQQKWLDGVSLAEFGYQGPFTRDLFEAEISVPGWRQPLHVFTTHLKSGFDADSVSRRGAEALAISNFVVNTYYPARTNQPFVLTGDFNEDPVVHATVGAGVVSKLTHPALDLRLTTPVHPVTGSERTFSIRASLASRLDYILPNGLLFSNIISSQTFRTGLLDPLPSGLLADDDRVASDHLAVLMTFDDPYGTAFRITRIEMVGDFLTLRWEAGAGRQYRIEWSNDFQAWNTAAESIATSGAEGLWITSRPASTRFYRLFENASN